MGLTRVVFNADGLSVPVAHARAGDMLRIRFPEQDDIEDEIDGAVIFCDESGLRYKIYRFVNVSQCSLLIVRFDTDGGIKEIWIMQQIAKGPISTIDPVSDKILGSMSAYAGEMYYLLDHGESQVYELDVFEDQRVKPLGMTSWMVFQTNYHPGTKRQLVYADWGDASATYWGHQIPEFQIEMYMKRVDASVEEKS